MVLGHGIHGYTVLAWAVAGAGLIGALLLQENRCHPNREAAASWRPIGVLAAVLATLLWVAASMVGLPLLGATFALVLWAWVLFMADSLSPRLDLGVHAFALLVFATVKWCLFDLLGARLEPGWDAWEYVSVLNPAMGVGVLLALSLGAIAWLRRTTLQRLLATDADHPVTPRAWLFSVAALMVAIVTIGLNFEVDRGVERLERSGFDAGWPPGHLKLLGLTLLWLTASLVLAWTARRLEYWTPLPWWLILFVTGQFLVIDLLGARIDRADPVPVLPLVNFQVIVAVAVLAGLLAMCSLLPFRRLPADSARTFPAAAGVLALLIVLWTGTLEIDRVFTPSRMTGLADPRLANQVAISIFWSLFAVATVVAGFRYRIAGLRYFGLGLFAFTLLKVVAVDLSQVQFGYRILSLLGLGLLLLGTSVLYGKLSPILLGLSPAADAGTDEIPQASRPG